MSLTISIELVVAKSQSPFLLYSVDIKIKTFSAQSSIVSAPLREIIISTELRRRGVCSLCAVATQGSVASYTATHALT